MRPPQKTGENDDVDEEGIEDFDTSMRPPQKTGENVQRPSRALAAVGHFNEAPAENGGKRQAFLGPVPRRGTSMRPPQKTGENMGGSGLVWQQRDTSMRPPQKTGENVARLFGRYGDHGTSMRPPQKTGENATHAPQLPTQKPHFNEAPAENGGKPVAGSSAQ